MPIGFVHIRQTKSSQGFREFMATLDSEARFGGQPRPDVCARCTLLERCARTGCDMTALEAVAYLNGGRPPDPPKVAAVAYHGDLTDCPIPAENPRADAAQQWTEQRGG